MLKNGEETFAYTLIFADLRIGDGLIKRRHIGRLDN